LITVSAFDRFSKLTYCTIQDLVVTKFESAGSASVVINIITVFP